MEESYNYYHNESLPAIFLSKLRNKGLFYSIKKTFSFSWDILISPFISLKRKRYFNFNNKRIPYFYHRYNKTWKNERAIEIPIFLDFIRGEIKLNPNVSILEVGNVLAHYTKIKHPIVDKYENSPGILNEDVVAYSPKNKYDLIVSISTLEHVGLDDSPPNAEKTYIALINLQKNCLSKNGKMLISFPVNYNKRLMECASKSKGIRLCCFRRVNNKNIWKQETLDSIKNIPHTESEIPSAVIFMELNKKSSIK